MADTKVSALAALLGVNAAAGDLLTVVDVSDTTMAASGTNKSITLAELAEFLERLEGLPRIKRLGTQHAISSVTGTKVTDLDLTLGVGTFTFKYSLILRSATTSVSPLLGINFTGTGAPRMHFRFADASSSLLAELHTMDDQGSQAFGFISGMANNVETTTAPNMGSSATLAVATAATDTLAFIEGILVATVGGNLELWHSSETATATSVEVGSSLVCVQTA
jgi:hypothetical protein